VSGQDSRKIEILGSGCARCQQLYKGVVEAVGAADLDADVEKVEDISRIMAYGVMSTPALVIDGKLIFSGKVPSVAELKKILTEA
jgi:small redox-active disulfide protein 2